MYFILYHTWGNDSFCKRYLICKRRPPKDTLSVTTPLPPSLTPPRRGAPSPGSAVSRYVLPSRTSSLSGSLMLLPVFLLAISGWMVDFR